MGKLAGKVALITGAGSGIGQATAVLFAKELARVVVADCAPRGGQETVKMIKEAGGDALYVQVDVSKTVDVERVVAVTVRSYGKIDILFNNAGVFSRFASTAETKEEDWDLAINTNLKGVFLCTKYAIPAMLSQGKGVIINTSSGAGLVASPGLLAYGVSKAGVIHLTKTAALEYARQNIRVNCICPGAIHTPMYTPFLADGASLEPLVQRTPLGRIGQPSEIAQAALYLACDDSSFVTGAVIAVDGGGTAGFVTGIS